MPATLPNSAARSGAELGADTQALMTIRNLELRARSVVEGFWHGLHRSPYHGFSVEFTEYRLYSPGDDLRYLDWKLLARSDRQYLKKFEDETNLRCHLIVDNSRSMDFGSVGYTKAAFANTLAATLAYFLSTQGDATGLLTFDADVKDYLPARNRPGHLRRLMLTLENSQPGTATNLVKPLERIAGLIRKRSLMVFISDMLAPLDELEREFAALTAVGHELVLFQVLDPTERDFGFDKPMLFEDRESGKEIYIDPVRARDGYLKRLREHTASIRRITEALGIAYHQLGTTDRLDLMLLAFLEDRQRRGGRNVNRRSPAR